MSGADPMSPETRALFEELQATIDAHMLVQKQRGARYVHAAIDVIGVLGELIVPTIAAIEDGPTGDRILGLLLKHLPGGVEKCRRTMAQSASLSETMQ